MKTKEQIEHDISVCRKQMLQLGSWSPFDEAYKTIQREVLTHRIQSLLWVLEDERSSDIPPEYYGTSDPEEAAKRHSFRDSHSRGI